MTLRSKISSVWDFLKTRKKWWLGPVIVFLLLVCIFIILKEEGGVDPMRNLYP